MKNKLIELIDGLREELTPNAYIKISNAVRSLPDDQPDLLPFQWPVPKGMEVVTRDGRKVEKVSEPDIDDNVIYMGEQGRWQCEGVSRLFLRRMDKKVWVVEWPDGYMEYYPTMDHADHRIWSRNLPESTDKKHGGEPKKYEATLKPVV